MFDLPDAKRVRRSDLYSRSRSHSPSSADEQDAADPALEKALHSRLAALYGPISISSSSVRKPHPSAPNDEQTPPSPARELEAEPEQEQEYEFRLFSTTSTSAQKIVLEEDRPATSSEGAFLTPHRPPSYYISRPATGEQKQRFALAAIDGVTVLQRAKDRAWGLEVPWRVRVLTVVNNASRRGSGGKKGKVQKGGVKESYHDAGDGIGVELQGSGELQVGKRKKPGKKRRIIMRERRKKKEGIEEQRKREREEREEAEREKRTRRNREKKVKRKMKEKAKKSEGGVGGVGDVDGVDGGGGDS